MNGKIINDSLITEAEWYAKKKHAEIVFKKCMAANKVSIAIKIAYKYEIEMKVQHDDIVMSLGMMLMSKNNKNI